MSALRPEHVQRSRPLMLTEECDRTVHLRPVERSDCGPILSGNAPNSKRDQANDLPSVKPIVTERQIHTRQCLDCETTDPGMRGFPGTYQAAM